MQWRDNQQRYGLLRMLLHWTVALLLPLMVILGLWLTSLGRFDPALRQALFWHQGLGLLLALLMLLRALWRLASQTPQQGRRTPMERYVLRKVRLLLYLLVFVACVSGYLLATGGNRELFWFDLLRMPQLLQLGMGELEQVKAMHQASVWALCALVVLHVLAALKYQLLNKEPILQRMLGRR